VAVTRSAKLTDLTLAPDSSTSSVVALTDTPQTGSLSSALRSSQFAALAADVNPAAVLMSFSLNVLAVPHSLAYPDRPLTDAAPMFSLSGRSAADVDYGTVSYGQFFDAL